MTFRIVLLTISLVAVVTAVIWVPRLTPAAPQGVCIDFEPPLTLGTRYGAPAGHRIGDLALTTKKIPIRLHEFLDDGSMPPPFDYAEIVRPPFPFSAGQSMRASNINLELDFRQLGFRPSQVELAFLDLNIWENLSINGSAIFKGDLAGAPANVGGINVAVAATRLPPPDSGKKGTVTLTGNVEKLLIGGQELWLDEVCARP